MSIITVDSTIGTERNGEFLIGDSLIQYKESSNQFVECTRSVNNIVEDWDCNEVHLPSVYVNKELHKK